jgi:hypothetical protein
LTAERVVHAGVGLDVVDSAGLVFQCGRKLVVAVQTEVAGAGLDDGPEVIERAIVEERMLGAAAEGHRAAVGQVAQSAVDAAAGPVEIADIGNDPADAKGHGADVDRTGAGEAACAVSRTEVERAASGDYGRDTAVGRIVVAQIQYRIRTDHEVAARHSPDAGAAAEGQVAAIHFDGAAVHIYGDGYRRRAAASHFHRSFVAENAAGAGSDSVRAGDVEDGARLVVEGGVHAHALRALDIDLALIDQRRGQRHGAAGVVDGHKAGVG